MNNTTPATVNCRVHGRQSTNYACQHVVQSLNNGIPQGFWWSASSGNDARPVAWCNACEAEVNEFGEWNETYQATANIMPLCEKCYELAKAMNIKKKQKKWWHVWKSLSTSSGRSTGRDGRSS